MFWHFMQNIVLDIIWWISIYMNPFHFLFTIYSLWKEMKGRTWFYSSRSEWLIDCSDELLTIRAEMFITEVNSVSFALCWLWVSPVVKYSRHIPAWVRIDWVNHILDCSDDLTFLLFWNTIFVLFWFPCKKTPTKLAKIMSKVLCKNRKPVAIITEYVRNVINQIRGQFDAHIYIFKISCTNTVYIYMQCWARYFKKVISYSY